MIIENIHKKEYRYGFPSVVNIKNVCLFYIQFRGYQSGSYQWIIFLEYLYNKLLTK